MLVLLYIWSMEREVVPINWKVNKGRYLIQKIFNPNFQDQIRFIICKMRDTTMHV